MFHGVFGLSFCLLHHQCLENKIPPLSVLRKKKVKKVDSKEKNSNNTYSKNEKERGFILYLDLEKMKWLQLHGI